MTACWVRVYNLPKNIRDVFPELGALGLEYRLNLLASCSKLSLVPRDGSINLRVLAKGRSSWESSERSA